MRKYGPRAEWMGRSLRRAGFDHNPMRRSTDRIQATLRAGLLAVFLIGGPIATTYVGHAVYISGLQTGRAQAADWHRVPALVIQVTPVATAWRHPTSAPATFSVRWTTPDGSPRTGKITGGGEAVVGSIVTVWIDEKGRLTGRPLSRADVADHMIGVAVATTAALALLLCVVGWVVSLVLDRYRLAGWEADWSAVEPQWTRRR
jgi:hypothetical protein